MGTNRDNDQSADGNTDPQMSKSALKKQQAEIRKLIRDAQAEKDPGPSRQIESEADLRSLAGVISEYLESYILLGYDMNGNAIHVCLAKTQQHADSLTTLLNNTSMPSSNNNNDDDES